MPAANDTAELFKHVSAEKNAFYRCIMDVFAAAKRQYRRLQLRDRLRSWLKLKWPAIPPPIKDVSAALAQTPGLGQFELLPDTARVSSLSDFYRARFLYRLSQGGEAVHSALASFHSNIATAR